MQYIANFMVYCPYKVSECNILQILWFTVQSFETQYIAIIMAYKQFQDGCSVTANSVSPVSFSNVYILNKNET